MAEVQQNEVVEKRKSSGLVYNKCCFCVPLRTGSIIIGYLNLVSFVIVGINSIMVVDYVINGHDEVKQTGHQLLIVTIVAAILNVIMIPFDILLLVGLHMGKRRYIKIYLIYTVFYLVIITILQVVQLSSGYEAVKEFGHVFWLCMVFNLYFLIVVRSQYVKMGESSIRVPDQQLNTIS